MLIPLKNITILANEGVIIQLASVGMGGGMLLSENPKRELCQVPLTSFVDYQVLMPSASSGVQI